VLDLDAPLTSDTAEALIRHSALEDTSIGTVGLEVETHLVDLDEPGTRVSWKRITAVLPELERAAGSSAITLEPGGQLELSGPPLPEVVAAVQTMRSDVQRVRLALAEHRLGLAHVGADPFRPPIRVNPKPRYTAMEEHFAGLGLTEPGRVMMCSTAALQVNLQAGPESGWADRVRLALQLGPTLMAVSASSPWLSGRASGFASAREQAWARLGDRQSASDADPIDEWVQYALRAPVMFVRTPERDAEPVTRRVGFTDWLAGRERLAGRVPSGADLQTHLSTLFPPIRLRGFLEIRYLDISGPRWWPAVAAAVTVLLDDPVAADLAREATERTAGHWAEAAHDGLRDRLLHQSARACLAVAAERAPAPLAAAVADLAELVTAGRSPGDLIAERIAEIGPQATFEELAHA